jgi:hypothetical protein
MSAARKNFSNCDNRFPRLVQTARLRVEILSDKVTSWLLTTHGCTSIARRSCARWRWSAPRPGATQEARGSPRQSNGVNSVTSSTSLHRPRRPATRSWLCTLDRPCLLTACRFPSPKAGASFETLFPNSRRRPPSVTRTDSHPHRLSGSPLAAQFLLNWSGVTITSRYSQRGQEQLGEAAERSSY